jgi:hypothetical protein
MKWLNQGCSEANGWCGGAGFTFDTKVNYFDLALLADCWLVRDTLPPMPNIAVHYTGARPPRPHRPSYCSSAVSSSTSMCACWGPSTSINVWSSLTV